MGGSRSLLVASLLFITTCTHSHLPDPIRDPMKWPVPEEPYQAAARLWASKHGKPDHHCVEQIKNATYRVLDEVSLAYACRRKDVGEVSACMEVYSYDRDEPAIIDLADTSRGTSYSIRVHELLHVLMWCHGFGPEDRNLHKDGVWSLVPPDELPKESPWYRTPVPKILKDPKPGSEAGCTLVPLR